MSDSTTDNVKKKATAKSVAKGTKGVGKERLRSPSSTVKSTSKRAARGAADKEKETLQKGSGSSALAKFVSFTALLFALLALFLGGWLYQQLQAQSGQHSQIEQQVAHSARAQQQKLSSLQDAGGQMRGDIQGLGSRVDKRLGNFEASLSRLQGQMGQGSDGWVIAEIEYLLEIANHQLLLNRDNKTALAALELADRRLAKLADPALIPLREQVIVDIQALRTSSHLDKERIVLEISALIGQVEGLAPLHGQRTTAANAPSTPATPDAAQREAEDQQGSGWSDELLTKVWSALRELVVVRHHDRPVQPLINPGQQLFLQLNLQHKLESARLALLNSNSTLYRSALEESLNWSQRYFNQESVATRHFIATLERLRTIEVQPQLPDISGALRILRTLHSTSATSALEQSAQ